MNAPIKGNRKVGQFTKDDQLLEIFPTYTQAARSIHGASEKYIGLVCRGKAKTHMGYKWKLMDN